MVELFFLKFFLPVLFLQTNHASFITVTGPSYKQYRNSMLAMSQYEKGSESPNI